MTDFFNVTPLHFLHAGPEGIEHFRQLINTPTRISDRSESLIDVLYTTHTESVIQHGCVHTTISDHFMVYAIRRLQSNHRDKFGQFTTSYFRSYEDFVSSDF